MIPLEDARDELTVLRDTLLDVGYKVEPPEDHPAHGVAVKVKLPRSNTVHMTVWCAEHHGQIVYRFGHPQYTPPLGPVDDLDVVVDAVQEVFGSP